MKYSSIDVDQFGRAIYCPMCGYETLFLTESHCPSCDMIIVNKCADTKNESKKGWEYIRTSCGSVLDGDSRYCIKCGNESTFFQNELLDSWQIEKDEKPDSYSEVAISLDITQLKV